MADLFGAWVPQEWIDAVLAAVRRYPQHTFQMLTKSPKRAASIEMPPNAWLGSTITGGLAGERGRLDAVRRYQAPVRFLSCEPLCGPVDVARAEPDWLIIGAATGPGGFQPDEGWVDELERWADERGCPIYHKENLACRASSRRTEFPGTARA
jgi:protein gp37